MLHGLPQSGRLRFFDEDGIEVPAVSAPQMREVDRLAMNEAGLALLQMMENAGRTTAMLTLALLGNDWQDKRVVVLAGAGGNGGGICCARHLANHGALVEVALVEPYRLNPAAEAQRRIFAATSGQEVDVSETGSMPDLIVDALVGYGLVSAPREPIARLIRWANRTHAPILSLDVPSGVNATTGATPGEFIRPRWTVTLALPKTGLWPDRTSDLLLADIGIPEDVYRGVGLRYSSPFGRRSCVRLKSSRTA